MSDEPNDIFDVDRVRDLVEMMIEHGLTEVDLRQHGQTIRLRRGGETVVTGAPMMAAPITGPPSAAAASPTPAEDADAGLLVIKSPMVGTYYERPNPESDAFVKVGQEVSQDTTVCIIEAMKVFNEIAAEVSGTIVSILVENEEPVDVGKPLFKVRPR